MYAVGSITSGDLTEVHAIFSDPATWIHLPDGRFTTEGQTAAMIRTLVSERDDVGLSLWTVRATESWDGVRPGDLIGIAGVSPRSDSWWNLGYRLAPVAWGRGISTQVVADAIRQARTLRPDWPVVSRLLSSNPASERVSRRLGLDLKWRGPSAAAHGVERLILADRDLEPRLLERLVALG